MLAQLQAADPIHVRDFLIIGGFLLSAGTGLVALVQSGRKQKREVSLSAEHVTKEHCGGLHAALAGQLAGMEQRAREADEYSKTRRQALYAELKASREEARGAVEALRREIKDELARLFELLREGREENAALRAAAGTSSARLQTMEEDIKTLLRRVP